MTIYVLSRKKKDFRIFRISTIFEENVTHAAWRKVISKRNQLTIIKVEAPFFKTRPSGDRCTIFFF